MDVQKEFVERVNDAVKAQCQAGPGNHKGEEIRVIIPTPEEFLIDCNDASGIDLDDVRISVLANKEVKDANGNILLDEATIKTMGAVLYEVRGLVK